MKASPAAVPSTTRTDGGSARATSSPSSSRIAPSAPSVTATSLPRSPDDLVLEPVHDQQVGLDVDRPGGCRVQAEEPRLLRRGVDRVVGDLQLADDRIRVGDVDLLGRDVGVRSRRDDDLVLAQRVHEDQRDAGVHARLADPFDAARVHAGLLEAGQRLVGELVDGDRAHEANVRAESGCRHGLVGALARRARGRTTRR